MTRLRTIALAMLVGCSTPVVGDDASMPDTGGACRSDVDCDDGLYCNGGETCRRADPRADARGCVVGASPCSSGTDCIEATHQCTSAVCTTLDADHDGVASVACGGTDCDDGDADRFPGHPERCDASAPQHDEDCDPCTVASAPMPVSDGDHDRDVYVASTCANAFMGSAPACDPSAVRIAGTLVVGGDCDDADANVHPNQPEGCDGADDDCDGLIDEGVARTFYRDADMDGFGSDTDTSVGCTPPAGYVTRGGDCDDASPASNPTRSEVCNGIDDDCDAVVDEDAMGLFYRDADGDLHGDASASTTQPTCTPPTGYVMVAGDCNDLDARVYVGASELCDGVDDACALAGAMAGGPEPNEDADGDHHAPIGAACMGGFPVDDCDDARVLAHAGAIERCDGHDDDCDGTVDEAAEASSFCGAGSQCIASACTSTIGLAVGTVHACALRGGTVLCWGQDHGETSAVPIGMLGDGGIYPMIGPIWYQLAPVPVLGLTDAVEIGASTSQTCARRATGEVACWGGFITATMTVREQPIAIAGITDAVELAVGAAHACVRRLAGGVLCWGDNSHGQLGDGTFVSREVTVAPVVGLTDALEIAAGGAFTCARRVGGAVSCWGAAASGQLGDGTSSDRAMPAPSPALTGAVELALGDAFGCARFPSGAVECWGDGTNGQIGDGMFGSRAMPTPTMGSTDAIGITAGATHACATRAAGGLSCWGGNANGQLGGGTSVDRSTPTPVLDLATTIGAAASDVATCARDASGAVSCWGAWIAMGYPNSTVGEPEPVRGIGSAVQVATGYEHSCARLLDGTIACWGMNEYGQLGDATLTMRPAAVPVSGIVGAIDVAAGGEHSCAVDAAGSVWCWGANPSGGLGDGATHAACSAVSMDCSSVPVQAAMPIVSAQVVAGGSDEWAGALGYSCALGTDGSVACWGDNTYGQLGDATTTSHATPAPVAALGMVTQLATTQGFVCARLSTGELRCWGQNGYGQLGDGTTTDRSSPVAVMGVSDAIAVAASANVTFAVRASDASALGRNFRLELGDGLFSSHEVSPHTIVGITDALALGGGYEVGYALHATGTLSTWGASSPIATRTLADATPAPVFPAVTDAVQLAAASGHTCIVLAGGGVACWGYNAHGECGTGAYGADRVRPHPVTGLP